MKEKKKAVTYRIRETTIQKVRNAAKKKDVSINDYVDAVLSKTQNP